MRSSIPLFALVVVTCAVAALAPWAGSTPSTLPTVTQFTAPTGVGHWNPCWCPDGSQIAFDDYDADPYNPSLAYKNYPSGTEQEMAAAHRENMDYAPNLTQIVYDKLDGTWTHIYVRPIAGGTETALTSGTAGPNASGFGDIQPTFSPDGQWVAFASSRDDSVYGRFDIWVVKTDGTNLKKIAPGQAYDPSLWPTWQRDGNGVVYSDNGNLYVVARTGPTTWMAPEFLASNGNHARFSHDGKYLAFDWQGDVYAMNVATQARVNITNDGASPEDSAPTWGPTDDSIAFSSVGRGGVAQKAIWIASGVQAVPTQVVTLGQVKATYR
ncbi:MAG TPA: hypothetical protein VGR66_13365 [Candidatus Eisenbacteria bacterium]|nr:hypothetical protein [Candidatus Eisenbacteria bacterium]